MEIPFLTCRLFSKSNISIRIDMSSIDVGSSAMISWGWTRRTLANAIRCLSPPDISCGNLYKNSSGGERSTSFKIAIISFLTI